MTTRSAASFRMSLAATALFTAQAVLAQAPAEKSATSKPLQSRPVQAPDAAHPDRAAAYYHDGLARMYEEMAVSNGRPDYASQAVEEYKLALNADPGSKYLQDGLADLYFRLGRIREAVTAAQEQVKNDPNDAAAHTLLGKVYLRSLNDMQGPQANEMLQLAIGEYEKLAVLKPKDVETHLMLGQLYGVNHDSGKAERQFKIAQSLDNNSEEAVLNMARLYGEQGEFQKSIQSLNVIPEADRSPRVNFALGAAYDQVKDYKRAAAAYRAAYEDEPENTDTQKALAAALLNDDQLPQALEIYQQLVQADPNDGTDEVKVADIQRRQGHYDEALKSLEKAKTLPGNGDNLEMAFQEAVLLDATGKFVQAEQVLIDALAAGKHLNGIYADGEKNNRAIFLDRLAVIYKEEGKTNEAVDAYKQLTELGSDYVVRGYQGQIDTLREAHQWKEALDASAALAKLYPKDHAVQLTYAMQLADAGQQDQAISIANAQLTGTAEDRETLTNIAIIDLRLHRSPEALASLDKAEAFATEPPEHFGIDLLRATVYDHDKKFEPAEAAYKKALAVDPNNPTVLNDYGYMLADHGVRLPEALAMLQKAVRLDPQNGAYLDSLGWVYFKLGQYGPAEQNLHQAIDRTPTDPSIRDHLGEVYEKTGRLKLAVTQWERSMTEYAHSLPADADPADVAKVKAKLEEARTKLAHVSSASGKKS